MISHQMEWKKKEGTGDFTPIANKDALYMVLGKDHAGRVKGTGGVRVGAKKAFGEEYKVRQTTSEVYDADLKSHIDAQVDERVKAIFERYNLPGLDELFKSETPGDKESRQREHVTSNDNCLNMQRLVDTPHSHHPLPNLEVNSSYFN